MKSIVKKNASFIGKDCFAICNRGVVKIHVLYLTIDKFVSRIIWSPDADGVGNLVISNESVEFYSTFEDAEMAFQSLLEDKLI